MSEFINAMEKRLTDDERKQLKNVWQPVEVLAPGNYTLDNLVVLRDGEIRCYYDAYKKDHHDKGTLTYYSSTDCGLSWKWHTDVNEKEFSRGVYIEELDLYIKMLSEDGMWKARISRKGPGDNDYATYDVAEDIGFHMSRSCTYCKANGCIVAVSQYECDTIYYPMVFLSFDEGKTWEVKKLETLPKYDIEYPHKGLRWQNHCCEPSIVSIDDNTLIIIVRTSRDYHYRYLSYDGGKTWSAPERTNFHSTLTMPLIKKLTSGELIFLWCNTQPLPELDHKTHLPPASNDEDIINGVWEDFFTNRDANHAAISNDNGKTWHGFREMGVSPIRNESDFRSHGGINECNDKSVHQFECVQLPYGKLLVSYGQHKSCCRLVIFDKNWLYEKERKEDWKKGLKGVSTHVYVKSNAGGFGGFSGHCAYNRTHGALLMPDPDLNNEEALFISRIHDPRLISEVQGVVWNFPASKSGRVKVKLRNDGCGVRVSVTDRWFNPCDTFIREAAQISFNIDKTNSPAKKWIECEIVWKGGKYSVYIHKKQIITDNIRYEYPNGLSYLHIQSLAEEPDYEGTYIKYIEKSE